jgi:hypothetical protein
MNIRRQLDVAIVGNNINGARRPPISETIHSPLHVPKVMAFLLVTGRWDLGDPSSVIARPRIGSVVGWADEARRCPSCKNC